MRKMDNSSLLRTILECGSSLRAAAKQSSDAKASGLLRCRSQRRYIKTALFLSLMYANLSFALPEDRDKPAALSANSADLNQLTHQGEYKGEVILDQGTRHLRADRAITKGDKNNQLTEARAFGTSITPAHYWEQTATDKPPMHAYAQEIHYYPKRHLIELIGSARVTQGDNSFSAPKIIYDTEKQHVMANGGKKSPILIIMHTEKKHG
jgi:lipopolysaccharide export system protein LptA